MMRIGLLGGSFNPIHLGHLHLAESVRNELQLDKVIFIPTRINPFKDRKKDISDFERYEMVKLAIRDNPYFEISDFEIKKEGKSYTIETLQYFKSLYPDTALFFITGADIMFEITRWREAETLLKLVSFVSCCRPGYSQRKFDRRVNELKEQFGADIIKLVPPQMDISSSHIRSNIAKNFSIRYMVPDIVREFIYDRKLYTDAYNADDVREEIIQFRLKYILKSSRYEHTLNVVQCADDLAVRYHCDVKKARMAALLHDCAKNYSDAELIELAKTEKITVDAITATNPQLLHGPVGAVIAMKEYGIEDEDILNAIKYHTTGRIGMSDLEKIIYLADYVEPGRQFPGVEDLRQSVNESLDQAMIEALTHTIRYIASKGGLLHGLTIDTRNHYLLSGKTE